MQLRLTVKADTAEHSRSNAGAMEENEKAALT